ncbi:hypothetical protein HPB47_028249 [Ixodes persulcatus]|uniref:Uncharacterized protein n=1 Tax=Ixodes persulcatus TaxID=34615 RepID=A0AC60PTR7_IXOPE|nr:hypothetical protein HPB47_028249 [Ixodes persulcatus]
MCGLDRVPNTRVGDALWASYPSWPILAVERFGYGACNASPTGALSAPKKVVSRFPPDDGVKVLEFLGSACRTRDDATGQCLLVGVLGDCFERLLARPSKRSTHYVSLLEELRRVPGLVDWDAFRQRVVPYLEPGGAKDPAPDEFFPVRVSMAVRSSMSAQHHLHTAQMLVRLLDEACTRLNGARKERLLDFLDTYLLEVLDPGSSFYEDKHWAVLEEAAWSCSSLCRASLCQLLRKRKLENTRLYKAIWAATSENPLLFGAEMWDDECARLSAEHQGCPLEQLTLPYFAQWLAGATWDEWELLLDRAEAMLRFGEDGPVTAVDVVKFLTLCLAGCKRFLVVGNWCHLFSCFAKAVTSWAEYEGILGELQNGFRKGRRLEDNLFVITQAMEIANHEQRPLYLGFLDISKAYDSVNHSLLWRVLEELGMPVEWRNLLQQIYRDNSVVVQWGAEFTEPIKATRGLRQGCPLSPLLFMLYIAGLERALEDSRLGFRMCYGEEGRQVDQRIPALIYADDVVLMAGSLEELQELLDTCGEEGTTLGLTFNPSKSGVLRAGMEQQETQETEDAPTQLSQKVNIQGQEIEWRTEYKYLGVTLQSGQKYLEQHEAELRTTANKRKGYLGCRGMWSFSRYETVRALWKMVAVPGLTFANAVLCLSARTREHLEVRQREVGRLALGTHRNTTSEYVQGDMGWSCFEAREASSKLIFERRLCTLPEQRSARQVFKYIHLQSINTRWVKRVNKLTERYDVPRVLLCEVESPGTAKRVRERVKEAETTRRVAAVGARPSLAVYGAEKKSIVREEFIDNSRGSGLLCEARSGVLRTRHLRSKYTPGMDGTCQLCGQQVETAEHIIMECRELRPPMPPDLVDYAVALGLKRLGPTPSTGQEQTTQTTCIDEVGGRDHGGQRGQREDVGVLGVVEITKRRLEDWWGKTKLLQREEKAIDEDICAVLAELAFCLCLVPEQCQRQAVVLLLDAVQLLDSADLKGRLSEPLKATLTTRDSSPKTFSATVDRLVRSFGEKLNFKEC